MEIEGSNSNNSNSSIWNTRRLGPSKKKREIEKAGIRKSPKSKIPWDLRHGQISTC